VVVVDDVDVDAAVDLSVADPATRDEARLDIVAARREDGAREEWKRTHGRQSYSRVNLREMAGDDAEKTVRTLELALQKRPGDVALHEQLAQAHRRLLGGANREAK